MSYTLGFAPSHEPSDESAEEMRMFDRPKPHLYLVRNEPKIDSTFNGINPAKMYQEVAEMPIDDDFSQAPPTPPIKEKDTEEFAKKALMKYLPSYFCVTNNGWVVPDVKNVQLVEVKPYSNLHIFKYQLTNGGKIKFGVVPNQEKNFAEVSVLKEPLTEQSYFGSWLTMRNIKSH